MNLSLNTLSIVSAGDTKVEANIRALKASSNLLKPKETIYFTSKKILNNSKNLRIVNIDPLKSPKDYNYFIIYDLFKYINTSHVLIVQYDGFVINPNKWNKLFFEYDYIGAPFIPRDDNEDYCRDTNKNFYSIGNGGFTFRSKQLLEAPTKYNLKDDYTMTRNHEDGFFSVFHRSLLEKKGFKWAPYKVATDFSIEYPLSIPMIFSPPVGFHGKKMLLIYSFLYPYILIYRSIYLIKDSFIKFFIS